MSQTHQIQQLDPETLQDLKDLRDTREEVLRQLGREIGIEEGREIGIEEGRDLGIEEARKEIAKNLLMQDISLDVIAKATGLSLEQLTSLRTSPTHTTPKKT